MNEEIIPRLVSLLRENAAEEHDWGAVDASTTIKSLGFDSLSVLDLLYDVDEEFGIEFEAEDVADLRTVGEIAALLQARGG